jgi:hypothetical protein
MSIDITSSVTLEPSSTEIEVTTQRDLTVPSAHDVDIQIPTSIIEGVKKEYSIVGDGLYASITAEETPFWLASLIDTTVITSIASGMVNYDLLVQDVQNAIGALELAQNTYVEQITIDATINDIITTRLTTLNATVGDISSTILTLDSTVASNELALAQSISDINAALGSSASQITDMQLAITTADTALASDISNLGVTFNNEISAQINSVSAAYVAEDNALAQSITALDASLNNEITTQITNTQIAQSTLTSALASDITVLTTSIELQNGTIATSISDLDISSTAYTDAVGTSIENRFAYNSEIKIGNEYYKTGFGLDTTVTTSGDGTVGNGYSSEFWIDAEKFKFTNPNQTGSVSPFSIDASGATPAITFNGTVSFSNATGIPTHTNGSAAPSGTPVDGSTYTQTSTSPSTVWLYNSIWNVTNDPTVLAQAAADATAKAAAAQLAAITTAAAAANAQAALDLITSAAYADGIVTAEEARAILDATTKADAAQVAAELASDPVGSAAAAQAAAIASAQTKATLAEVTASAYADGIVTAEEQRAIADATAKADTAEANAKAASDVVGAAAAAQVAAIASAQTKATLAQVTASAYADGIVTAEEARAILDATTKANAAESAAKAASDALGTAASAVAVVTSNIYAPGTTKIDGGIINTGSVLANISMSSPLITGGTIGIGSSGWIGNTTMSGGKPGVFPGIPDFAAPNAAGNGKRLYLNTTNNVYTSDLVNYGHLYTATVGAANDGGSPAVGGHNSGAGHGVKGVSNGSGQGGRFEIPSGNSSGSAHGIHCVNYNTGNSGLVAGANSYDFYADGSGVNYGPFTGAHDGLLPISDTATSIGDIVIDHELVESRGYSNTIFHMTASTTPNQKGALGVNVVNRGLLSGHQPAVFIVERVETVGEVESYCVMSDTYESIKDSYNVISINAVGEGQINITGEGGDLVVGDLVVTSSTAGKGMKQSDDIVRSYTVAKVRETVTFTSPSEIKMVACIYLCG